MHCGIRELSEDLLQTVNKTLKRCRNKTAVRGLLKHYKMGNWWLPTIPVRTLPIIVNCDPIIVLTGQLPTYITTLEL